MLSDPPGSRGPHDPNPTTAKPAAVAEVGGFDPVQCVFLLEPVSTAVR